MSEAALWDKMRPHLAPLDPVRVENALGNGTPDVEYAGGWIELKDGVSWPKKVEDPVRVHSLDRRPGQVAFLLRRWLAGGRCWVMTRVGRQVFLHPGYEAKRLRDGLTTRQFLTEAVWSSRADGRVSATDAVRLRTILAGDVESMDCFTRARHHRLTVRWTIEQAASAMSVEVDVLRSAEGRDLDAAQDVLDWWET